MPGRKGGGERENVGVCVASGKEGKKWKAPKREGGARSLSGSQSGGKREKRRAHIFLLTSTGKGGKKKKDERGGGVVLIQLRVNGKKKKRSENLLSPAGKKEKNWKETRPGAGPERGRRRRGQYPLSRGRAKKKRKKKK